MNETMTGQDELLQGLCTAEVLTRHNPCGLADKVFRAMAGALRGLMSREYAHGLSQDRVARYMGVSARTLRRWASEYEDFPPLRNDGFHQPSYDPVQVVEWWEKHQNHLKDTES